MDEENLDKQLDRILQMLDTRRNQFTDADADGQTLDVNDDVEVYDKVENLVKDEKLSEYIRSELKQIQRKIREAFLLARDLVEDLHRYD